MQSLGLCVQSTVSNVFARDCRYWFKCTNKGNAIFYGNIFILFLSISFISSLSLSCLFWALSLSLSLALLSHSVPTCRQQPFKWYIKSNDEIPPASAKANIFCHSKRLPFHTKNSMDAISSLYISRRSISTKGIGFVWFGAFFYALSWTKGSNAYIKRTPRKGRS